MPESTLTERIEAVEREIADIKTAFLKDDLGRPDYNGHRLATKEHQQAKEAMGELKKSAANRIVNAVLGGVLSLIGLGLLAFLKQGGHL